MNIITIIIIVIIITIIVNIIINWKTKLVIKFKFIAREFINAKFFISIISTTSVIMFYSNIIIIVEPIKVKIIITFIIIVLRLKITPVNSFDSCDSY